MTKKRKSPTATKAQPKAKSKVEFPSPSSDFEDHVNQVRRLSNALRIVAWDIGENVSEGQHSEALIGIAEALDGTVGEMDELGARLFQPKGNAP